PVIAKAIDFGGCARHQLPASAFVSDAAGLIKRARRPTGEERAAAAEGDLYQPDRQAVLNAVTRRRREDNRSRTPLRVSASLRFNWFFFLASWRLGALGAIQPARTANRLARQSLVLPAPTARQ